jgi:uncharacterized integral membrane protein
MSRVLSVLGVLLVVALSMGFAALNSDQTVTLHLGFVTFYHVSLTTVAFAALLFGMLIMLVAGVRSDLRVRSILRARLAAEDEEERTRFVDRTQRDLFESGSQGAQKEGGAGHE